MLFLNIEIIWTKSNINNGISTTINMIHVSDNMSLNYYPTQTSGFLSKGQFGSDPHPHLLIF